MTQLGILFGGEYRAVKSWFSTRTGSKLLVLTGFLLVFGCVSLGLFMASGHYFTGLVMAGKYGYSTAHYIIRASVLILIWLGIGSGAAGTANIFLSRNNDLGYILTLPVSGVVISLWQTVRTVILNTIFLGFLVVPVMLSFGMSFKGFVGFGYVIRILLGLLSVSAVTVSLGGIVGLLLLHRVVLRPYLNSFVGLFVFLSGLFVLFRLVFPPALEQLTLAAPADFDRIYASLPLASDWFPGNWLADIFTGTSSLLWLVGIGLAIILLGIYFWYLQHRFFRLYHLVNAVPAGGSVHDTGGYTRFLRMDFSQFSPGRALVAKDLAAVLRSPAETTYSVFLVSLMLFFFFLYSRVRINSETPAEWAVLARNFAYLGLLFFANTFLLRISFPAMAREGESAWYLFTRPFKRSVIWSSKLVYSLLISVPFLIPSLFIWLIPGFTRDYYLPFTIFSVATLLALAAVQFFTGMIFPNFSESGSAEKISTSPMGITCLLISSVLVGGTGFILNRYLISDPSWRVMAVFWFLGVIVTVGVLAFFSRRQTAEYQF